MINKKIFSEYDKILKENKLLNKLIKKWNIDKNYFFLIFKNLEEYKTMIIINEKLFLENTNFLNDEKILNNFLQKILDSENYCILKIILNLKIEFLKKQNFSILFYIIKYKEKIVEFMIKKKHELNLLENLEFFEFIINEEKIIYLEFLLKKDFFIDYKIKEKKTLLEIAFENENLNCLKYFLEKKANFKIIGNSVLEIVKKQQNEEVIFEILKYLIEDLKKEEKNNDKSKKEEKIEKEKIKQSQKQKILKVNKKKLEKKNIAKKLSKKISSIISEKDTYGNNALILLSSRGYLSPIKYLTNLIPKKNLNFQNNTGWTGLHWASINNHFETVSYLLSQNAKIDVPDNYGKTALFYSVQYKRKNICVLLVSKGAKIDFQDAKGDSPLFLGIEYFDFEIVKFLLENNADLNLVNFKHKCALAICVMKNKLDVVKLFFEYNCNLLNVDDFGENILHQCAKYDRYEILEFLQKKNKVLDFDLNLQNFQGFTPLMIAVKNGNILTTIFFLKNNININSKNKITGETVLHIGLRNKKTEILKLIFKEKEILFNLRDNQTYVQSTPFEIIVNMRYYEILPFFIDSIKNSFFWKNKFDFFYFVIKKNEFYTFKFLLENGHDFSINYICSMNLLIFCTVNKKIEFVDFLKKQIYFKDLSSKQCDFGWTYNSYQLWIDKYKND